MIDSVTIKGLDHLPVKTLGLGVFDGMHLAHQELFKHCDALLTFDPHPDILLNQSSTLEYLTNIEERQFYCRRLLVLEFTKDIAALTPEVFLKEIIQGILNPSKLVVGNDFKFGAKQTGNVETLKTWGKQNNIDVEEIPILYDETQEAIKSSLIRRELKQNFQRALHLLGHPYPITGTIIKGDGRGKNLGFPTANLATSPRKCIPKTGVYKGYTLLNETLYQCGIYIGTKPTFTPKEHYTPSAEQTIEVHIQSFTGDLYGKSLTIFLEKRLRDEKAFQNTDDLIQQIKKDLN